MIDINERMARVEESQQGLNTYLPLLLKRFEGIEDRLEADLNETRQELRETERKIEAKLETELKATNQKMDDIRKENSEGIAKLQSDNRNLVIALTLTGIGVAATGLAIAASIYFT